MRYAPTLTDENGASNKYVFAPAGSFVGRMQYAPTLMAENRASNKHESAPVGSFVGRILLRPYRGTTKNGEQTTKKPGTRRKNPATHPAFFTFRLGRYALSLSDVGDRNNIGEDTCCRHVGTGAVALDNHRILVITLGGDHNNVVASLQFVERMGATNLL